MGHQVTVLKVADLIMGIAKGPTNHIQVANWGGRDRPDCIYLHGLEFSAFSSSSGYSRGESVERTGTAQSRSSKTNLEEQSVLSVNPPRRLSEQAGPRNVRRRNFLTTIQQEHSFLSAIHPGPPDMKQEKSSHVSHETRRTTNPGATGEESSTVYSEQGSTGIQKVSTDIQKGSIDIQQDSTDIQKASVVGINEASTIGASTSATKELEFRESLYERTMSDKTVDLCTLKCCSLS